MYSAPRCGGDPVGLGENWISCWSSGADVGLVQLVSDSLAAHIQISSDSQISS